MLSISHVGWYHVVLTQPPDRRAGTLTDLIASHPLPQALEPTREKRAHGDDFIDLGPALRPAGRMLSISHVGWYHVVLTQPPDRRAGTLTDLRDDATTTSKHRPLDQSRRGVRNGSRSHPV